MPRVMISGWTLKIPTPMPLAIPAMSAARGRGRPRRPGPGPVWRGHDERRHRGDRPDRQVDATGQHRQRLAAGEDRERDRGADRRADPALRQDAGLRQLHQDDEQHEERGQRDERPIAEEPPRALGHRRRHRRAAPCRPARSCPRLPHREEAAEHDDPDEDGALDDGRQVRSSRRGGSGRSARGPG